MIYNIDFLVAALLFLLLIFYHFLSQRKVYNANSRVFTFFIVIGISDIVFDILCTVLISLERPDLAGITSITLTILYLMQATVPYAMFCYTETLRNTVEGRWKKNLFLWAIPFGMLLLLILFNMKCGLLFYFDDGGRYTRGSLYMLMYYYALAFVAVIAVSSILHFKELGWRKFGVIWEFLIIAGTCVMIQAYSNDFLMTGFGIAMGITVLFLTINNPYGYTDNLTGVFDKPYFSKWYNNEAGKNRKVHLLIVDLYQLKRVNKIFGTSVGDQVLIQAAKGMQEINDTNPVFRLTGNRFVLVTRTLWEYEKTRERIREFLDHGFWVGNERIYFPSVICGIIHGEQKLKKSDALLAYIDYMISLPPQSEEILLIQDTEKTMEGFRYEQEVEKFLQTAIEKDLFEVYYQPVYSMSRGNYITLEALSRLHHPALGSVSPEVFINIAEKNGQIAQIGQLQFRKVCRFIKENQEMMERIRNVKFNLSPLELLKPGYCHNLVEIIREYELSFSYFQFEITETVATEYCEELYQAVSEFQEVGIGLCLDDFGSGYANINTVMKLPFSSIKLDRSLLIGICEDAQIASFYHSIVTILSNLGYIVVAEGVEKKEEVELLRNWGVDMIQGYYFSTPMPEKQIAEEILGKE